MTYATDSSYGNGWECRRGYKENNGSCVALRIPKHAFLDRRGEDWQCERGYQKEDDSCTKIALPENAYLEDEGNDWQCDRGYRKKANLVLLSSFLIMLILIL